MARSKRERKLGILLLLTAWVLPCAAQPLRRVRERPLLALLTQIEGEARLATAEGSRERPARLLQGVAEGDLLRLGPGARVTLLCADASVLRLEQSRPIDPSLCAGAPSERRPGTGGIELRLGSLDVEGDARGDGAPLEPRGSWSTLETEQLERALDALDALALDAATRALTRAAILAGVGRLEEARTVLESVPCMLDDEAIGTLLEKLEHALETHERSTIVRELPRD